MSEEQDGIQEIYLATGALCVFPDPQLNAIVEYVGPLQQAMLNLDSDVSGVTGRGLGEDIQSVGTANAAGTSKKHTDASHVHQGVHSIKGFVDATEKYGDLILKIDATTAAATLTLTVDGQAFTLAGVKLAAADSDGVELYRQGDNTVAARNDHMHALGGVNGLTAALNKRGISLCRDYLLYDTAGDPPAWTDVTVQMYVGAGGTSGATGACAPYAGTVVAIVAEWKEGGAHLAGDMTFRAYNLTTTSAVGAPQTAALGDEGSGWGVDGTLVVSAGDEITIQCLSAAAGQVQGYANTTVIINPS